MSQKTKLEMFYIPNKRVELNFYKNSIIHWFVSEAIVAIALYAALKPVHATAPTASESSAVTDNAASPSSTSFTPSAFAPSSLFSPSPTASFSARAPKHDHILSVDKQELLEHVRFVSQLLKLVCVLLMYVLWWHLICELPFPGVHLQTFS
jgi:hypothetical protein